MKLDPKTGKYTFYKTPTPVLVIYGVGVDANDNIWFTEPGPDRLGFLDTQTGEISEINISAPDPDRTELDKQLAAKFEPIDQYGPPWQKSPRRQASDRKNGWQWIVLSKSGAVAKVDIHTRKVTEYPLPYPFSFPYSAAVDKDQMGLDHHGEHRSHFQVQSVHRKVDRISFAHPGHRFAHHLHR